MPARESLLSFRLQERLLDSPVPNRTYERGFRSRGGVAYAPESGTVN